jgi:hypothetical protein
MNIFNLTKVMGFTISLRSVYSYINNVKKIVSYFFDNYIPIIQLEGNIKIDEVFIKGKEGFNNGRNAPASIIFGLLCRESRDIVLIHVDDKSQNTLHPIIQNHVKTGSKIYSDKMASYVDGRNNISKLNRLGYQHVWTNHSL